MGTGEFADWWYEHVVNPKCIACGERVWDHKFPQYNDHHFNEIVLEGLS
jgi:hypothetical protein